MGSLGRAQALRASLLRTWKCHNSITRARGTLRRRKGLNFETKRLDFVAYKIAFPTTTLFGVESKKQSKKGKTDAFSDLERD